MDNPKFVCKCCGSNDVVLCDNQAGYVAVASGTDKCEF
jgi:anaerobic ribonucleoside-triphosphate reductase